MKKITISCLILFFGVITNSFAQSIDEMRKEIHEVSKDETFLKEFDSHITPNGEIRNSVVLSKNRLYKWYTYIHDPNKQQITLYDSHENIVFQNKSDQKGVVSFSSKCNKTAVYHLSIKNLTNQEISNIFILTFAGLFEPKDIEKITPEVTQTETIVNTQIDTKEEESTTVYFVVEDMPKFINEIKNFNEYLKKELQYPQEAKEKKLEGTVYVQFTVGKDGYIKDAKVVRGSHPALDQEALRIVYSSPKWKPGTQRGIAVDVILTFPIIFKLP